jgi:membrane fusion protein (multidrug efflux system)
MRALKPIIVIVAAVAVVLVAHRFIRRSEPEQRRGGGEVSVAAQVVEYRDFADRTEAIGTISANEYVAIAPAVTERIALIHFDGGEYVEKDDLLVELAHEEESAALEEARIDLAEQVRNLDRARTLRERDLVSQEELEISRGYVVAAEARVAAAEARLADRLIVAPFAGVLGMRRVSPGSLVSPGQVITTLDDLSVVKVDFTVPEAMLAQVGAGQTVEGRAAAWPDEVFSGTVRSIDSRVDPETRAVGVQARMPNPGRKLRAGMLLTIELTCRPREAPGVPERALLSYADRQYVYVVMDGGTVEQREITLGTRDVGWIEIVEGVEAGETVVVDGLMNLRDGASVRVERPGSVEPGSAEPGSGEPGSGEPESVEHGSVETESRSDQGTDSSEGEPSGS